jgi:acyl-CoA synthetase (NDP forming)
VPEASVHDLERLLRPRSIAVFGGSWAMNVVEQCLKAGFDGPIWPVHPSRREIHGLATFQSIDALPDTPDAAFIGVNREATIGIVRALRERGAGGAVCFASGFSESEPESSGGAGLERRLLEAAWPMPFLGPNCYGFINYLDGALLWPDQHGGRACARGVAILTQSSNMALNITMQRRGLPIAYVITLGNQARLDAAAVASCLLDDPRVTAIGLHLEGIARIRSFEAMADKARKLGKPVIALKVGRSKEARAQTLSHTASLAGSAAGSTAFLDRQGISTVTTLPAFLETLQLLHVHGPLAGDRLLAISSSGGEAGLIADLASGLGVRLPPFAPEQRARLRAVLGPKVRVANPLDYHTYIWGNGEAMTRAFTTALGGPFDLALFIVDWPRPDRCTAPGWDIALDAIIQAAKATGTPTAIVASLPENLPEDLSFRLVEAGIAPLAGMQEALVAIEAAVEAGRSRDRPSPTPVALAAEAADAGVVLTEAEAKTVLSRYGLAAPKRAIVEAHGSITAAAAALRYPLALKGLGIAHKSDVGAVALGLRDPAELVRAAERMAGIAANGFLVEEMVDGAVLELILGIVADPPYGFVLTIGAGGLLTELWQDSVSLLLPSSDLEIERALANLRLYAVLQGYRGRPGGDIRAVVRAVQAIAAYAADHHDRLLELDINPLIVRREGAIAADALIRLAAPKETRTP